MENNFYRFRSIKSLLGKHEELKKQEIYFASPSELNDPMEGYRDIFWKGDEIIWKNFFRHYLLCFEKTFRKYVIGGEKYHELSKDDIHVFEKESNFPTEMYKEKFSEICNQFFENIYIKEYINGLSKRSLVGKNELKHHIENLHIFALENIANVYEKRKLINPIVHETPSGEDQLRNTLKSKPFETLEKLSCEPNVSKDFDTFFAIQNQIKSELNLINQHNNSSRLEQKNKDFIFIRFPELYIGEIEKLAFPEWYTACFMSECTNSSVWGHYADNHRGVCLIFKTEGNDLPFITLNGVKGRSSNKGKIYGEVKHPLYEIKYNESYGKIDFFRSMGRLPISIIKNIWYKDDNGKVSSSVNGIFDSVDKWRKRYWEDFIKGITIKSKDWKYEKEYRAILTNTFEDYSTQESRKIKYEFSTLEGIVFGMNTELEDKLKIIKIIDEKCSETNRKDFKFYQAFYSSSKHCIDKIEMTLLKFSEA